MCSVLVVICLLLQQTKKKKNSTVLVACFQFAVKHAYHHKSLHFHGKPREEFVFCVLVQHSVYRTNCFYFFPHELPS